MEKKLVNFAAIVLNTKKKQNRDNWHGGPNSECHTLLNNNDTILTEE